MWIHLTVWSNFVCGLGNSLPNVNSDRAMLVWQLQDPSAVCWVCCRSYLGHLSRNLPNGNLQTMNMDRWETFNKSLGQTAPSAWECPITQFWGPLTENLKPLQGPPHTLTPPSMNTQNRSKNYDWFIMTCIELVGIGQKLSTTLNSKDLAVVAFK